MVLVEGAVEVVCAGFGDKADLGAGGAAGVGVGVAGGDAELFGGVLGGAEDAGEGEAAQLIVVVDAIEGDVALIGTAAVDGAAAAVLQGGVGAGGDGDEEDAGVEREQIGDVAGFAGERLDGGVAGGVADGGVGAIEGLRGGGDVDDFVAGLEGQGEVDGGGLIDEEFRVLGLAGEAGDGDGDVVGGGLQLLELVFAAGFGGGAEGLPAGAVEQLDGGAGNDGAAGVTHDATQGCGGVLREGGGCQSEGEGHRDTGAKTSHRAFSKRKSGGGSHAEACGPEFGGTEDLAVCSLLQEGE